MFNIIWHFANFNISIAMAEAMFENYITNYLQAAYTHRAANTSDFRPMYIKIFATFAVP